MIATSATAEIPPPIVNLEIPDDVLKRRADRLRQKFNFTNETAQTLACLVFGELRE